MAGQAGVTRTGTQENDVKVFDKALPSPPPTPRLSLLTWPIPGAWNSAFGCECHWAHKPLSIERVKGIPPLAPYCAHETGSVTVC